MILTRKQQEGLEIAIDRYKRKEKYTTIAGYAGAGKTTLINFIVDALSSYNIDPEEDIAFAAYTGKAAQVLVDKGCHNAKTTHKLLYDARPKPDGTFLYVPVENIDYKVVIVDECSMLPKDMMEQLLSYDVHVIFVGDPGQLPPIDKKQNNHLLDHPHIFLDEVMRQAQDSGIIRLSMKIRHGERIDNFKSEEAIVLPTKELNIGMLGWGNIILCAKNDTRKWLNKEYRKSKDYNNSLVENEKIIILNNDWGILSKNNQNALTNGCIGSLTGFYSQTLSLPRYIGVEGGLPIVRGKFDTDMGDDFGRLTFDKRCLIEGTPTLSGPQKYKLSKNPKYRGLLPTEATYGYAITTWKAQGSEFQKVLALEENFPFDREEHQKYLYTAVTRASKKIVLLRG